MLPNFPLQTISKHPSVHYYYKNIKNSHCPFFNRMCIDKSLNHPPYRILPSEHYSLCVFVFFTNCFPLSRSVAYIPSYAYIYLFVFQSTSISFYLKFNWLFCLALPLFTHKYFSLFLNLLKVYQQNYFPCFMCLDHIHHIIPFSDKLRFVVLSNLPKSHL